MTEVFVSPSQIATFRRCQRRWGWPAIAGIKEPQKPSAARGEAVHKHLEAWLESATLPPSDTDEGQIATSMIQHCPTPGTVLVERWITIKRNGYTIRARGDVLGPKLSPPLVQDHKTTADIVKWAKTEDELLVDPQALVYAAALFIMLAEQGLPLVDVEVRFVFGATRGKRQSKRVSVLLSLAYVERMLVENIDVTANDIVRAKRTCTNPLDLTPNLDACSDFGSCFYATGEAGRACNISPTEFLMSAAQQPANSIMSLFGGTPVNPPASPPPAAPPPPDAPLAGAPPQGVGSLGAALAAAPPPPPPVGLSALFSMQAPAAPGATAQPLVPPPPPLAAPPPPPAPALVPAQAHASVPTAPTAPPAAPGFLGLLAAQGAAPPPPAPVMPPPPAGIPVPLGGGTVMMTPPLPSTLGPGVCNGPPLSLQQQADLDQAKHFDARPDLFPRLPDDGMMGLRPVLDAMLEVLAKRDAAQAKSSAVRDKVQIACELIRAGHPVPEIVEVVEKLFAAFGGQS